MELLFYLAAKKVKANLIPRNQIGAIVILLQNAYPHYKKAIKL